MELENTKDFVRRVLVRLGNKPSEDVVEAASLKIMKSFAYLRPMWQGG
jgi:hypothetical protein